MAFCEMCGAERDSLIEVTVAGATLDVCNSCSDVGEPTDPESVEEEDEQSLDLPESKSEADETTIPSFESQPPMMDTEPQEPAGFRQEVNELAQDYDMRIKQSREDNDLSREELAEAINEEAKLIQKLEEGRTLPTDSVREKLETELGIDLLVLGGVQ